MAESITIKALQDASLDAKSLEEVVNGNDAKQVTTRLGESYPSVKKAITQIFENGGLPATPFATKSLMTASVLIDGKYAMVTDDTVNNGLYVKTAGAWVKSEYDLVELVKPYVDEQHSKVVEHYPDRTTLMGHNPKLLGQVAFVKDEGSYYKYVGHARPQQEETTALISRFSAKPSVTDEGIINRLIYDLKQAGVWDKLDGLWISRTTSFADLKLNWVSDKYNLVTEQSEPTSFVPRTSTFAFSINRFDTSLNPRTSTGLKLSQESITIGSLSLRSANLQKFLGAYNDTSGISLEYDSTTKIVGARLNQVNSVTAALLPSSDEYRTLTATRSGDMVEIYQDDTRLVSEQVPSVTPLDSSILIGKVSDTYKSTTSGIYAVFVGSAMTSEEVAATDKALRNYRERFAKPELGVGLWEKESEGVTVSSFATKALMESSASVDGKYAMVIDDTVVDNNGFYVKEDSIWKKSKYNIANLTQQKINQSTELLRIVENEDGLQKIINDVGENQLVYSLYEDVYFRYIAPNFQSTTEAEDYIAKLSGNLTDLDRQSVYYLFNKILESGIYNKLDGLWLGRTTDWESSKINLINGKSNLTSLEDGVIPKTNKADTGWSFGVSPTFDTNIPTNPDSNYNVGLDNATFGALFLTNRSATGLMGAVDEVTNQGVSLSYSSITNADTRIIDVRLNSESWTRLLGSRETSGAFSTAVITRKNGNITGYLNGEIMGDYKESATAYSTSPSTYKIGRMNPNTRANTAAYAAFIGEYLTAEEVALLDEVLQNYINSFARDKLPTGTFEKIEETTSELPNLGAVEKYVFNAPVTLDTQQRMTSTIDMSKTYQEYLGGYIEIQPDSWTGTHNTATDATTETWGFPHSLMPSEQARLRNDLFRGDGYGLQYIRFPLGFAYRGYRNIDPESGLARNIGERYAGQNTALRRLFENISKSGGGLAPEYWCPPVHWLTSGTYHGPNEITAGGSYDRSISLASIRNTDPEQYQAQIDAFTDAIVDDYEYIHTNIAPVKMYGLSNEPQAGKHLYGACEFDAETYSDIVLALHPKVITSEILSEYDGEPNKPLLHIASDDTTNAPWVRAEKLEREHPEYIWGYSHHNMRYVSGEYGTWGGDYYGSTSFQNLLKGRKNVFINEYEYFKPTETTHEYKCANNMLAYIGSMLYSDSRVIMPIIHVCKQLGATAAATNTDGYALVKCNLPNEQGGLAPDDVKNTDQQFYGTYAPVKHNYISWKFVADNMPIGAVRVDVVTSDKKDMVDCLAIVFEGKLRLFIANASAVATKVTVNLPRHGEYRGFYYDLNSCAKNLVPASGTSVSFNVPAYSGQVWIEQ